MKPFDPNATCPKCGGGEVTTVFVRRAYWSDYGGVQPDGEHLARTCTACGYAWAEAPMDAEESE